MPIVRDILISESELLVHISNKTLLSEMVKRRLIPGGSQHGKSVTTGEIKPAGANLLMTEKEVAAQLRLSPAMLQKMRREDCGPAFLRVGSAIRYPAGGVQAWVDALPRG